MINTDTKTTEFAKLFDFFEHLASGSQRPRNATVDSPKDSGIDDDSHTDSAQKTLAPLLKDLEAFLSTRVQHHTSPQPNSVPRPPQDTADATPPRPPLNEEDSSPEDAVPKFPLEEQYPFTFKLMIHKLYELREWAAKVKEVVEKSQKQFKPLAEKQVDDENGGGTAKEEPVVANAKKGAMPLTSKRSHLAMAAAKTRGFTAAPVAKSKDSDLRADTVVVKKRCVGRRKSTGGLSAGNADQASVGWSYDAAVSSVESNKPEQTCEIVTSVATGRTPWRSQSVAHLKSSGVRRTTTKFGTIEEESPCANPENVDSVPPMLSSPARSEVSAKRKAVTPVDVPDDARRMKMKRPLST